VSGWLFGLVWTADSDEARVFTEVERLALVHRHGSFDPARWFDVSDHVGPVDTPELAEEFVACPVCGGETGVDGAGRYCDGCGWDDGSEDGA
jgi:hypothetical protein